jgi:peptide/nickel transport system substrate-binding protein
VSEGNYWATGRVSRRSVLRGAGLGIAGMAGAALIGCGGREPEAVAPRPTAPPGGLAGAGTPAATPDPGATAVPADQVRVKAGIYDGVVPPSPAELNPMVNAKRGGTLQMVYLDPPRMDLNRTLSCTIFHTLDYTNNRLLRPRLGATAPLYSIELEPDLAESFEMLDGGEQFVFHLRKGIKTHNVAPVHGREFTSEDVVAGLELYRGGGSQQDVVAPITSVDAPDAHTVVLKLDRPLADFPLSLASWSFIYLKDLVDNSDLRQEKAIGTGPFIQKEWTPKERSVFVRNPDYFEEGLPFVDEVIAHVQPDVTTRRAGFQTSNYYHWNPRDDPDMEDMLRRMPDTLVAHKYPRSRGANVNGFQFQMENPIFQDDRVRQAFSLAFDRNEYDEARNAGDNRHPEGAYSNAPMPWAFLYDEYPTAKANGPWYQFDPQKASEFMQAAGYTREKPLEITLQSWYYRQELSELVVPGIAQNLPEVKIGWRQIDNPTHVTLMSDRNYPELIGFLWGPPGFSMDLWIYPFYHSTGGTNYGSINDAELDAKLDAQRAAPTLEEKKEIWQWIWERIHDKVYQAWFPEPLVRSAWPNFMLNFREHALNGTYGCYSSGMARSIWLDDGSPGVGR